MGATNGGYIWGLHVATFSVVAKKSGLFGFVAPKNGQSGGYIWGLQMVNGQKKWANGHF